MSRKAKPMSHSDSKFINIRVIVFALVMGLSWRLWWVGLPGVRDGRAVWLFFAALLLLFAWSFVLYRRERLLAWVCWLSILAMIFFAITLPGT